MAADYTFTADLPVLPGGPPVVYTEWSGSIQFPAMAIHESYGGAKSTSDRPSSGYLFPRGNRFP